MVDTFNILDTPSGNATSIAIIEHQEISGTDGGSSTSGSWFTRPLTTIVFDPDSIVSLASNQFVLQSGTYNISATSAFFNSSRVRTRLQNITDASTDLLSINNFISGSGNGGLALISGSIILLATKTFELQYQVFSARAIDGLGVDSSFGVSEIYARIVIEKTA